MPLAGLELTTFRATLEHSTPSPIGISHLASQVGISHHNTRSHMYMNIEVLLAVMLGILVSHNEHLRITHLIKKLFSIGII